MAFVENVHSTHLRAQTSPGKTTRITEASFLHYNGLCAVRCPINQDTRLTDVHFPAVLTHSAVYTGRIFLYPTLRLFLKPLSQIMKKETLCTTQQQTKVFLKQERSGQQLSESRCVLYAVDASSTFQGWFFG